MEVIREPVTPLASTESERESLTPEGLLVSPAIRTDVATDLAVARNAAAADAVAFHGSTQLASDSIEILDEADAVAMPEATRAETGGETMQMLGSRQPRSLESLMTALSARQR